MRDLKKAEELASHKERVIAELLTKLTPKEGFRIAIPSEVASAAWDAALERAAQLTEVAASLSALHDEGQKAKDFSKVAEQILALKSQP